MEQRRKTGIEIIDTVPWGTHFCQFYETKEDLINILVPYFKAGLENNEFCMWVTSKPLSQKEAREALKKAVPDFDHYLKKGQIEIIPHTKWYVKKGEFNSQKVLDGWVDKLSKALAGGHEGLRLTGNTFWLEKKDWKAFTDYEEEVNKVIGKYRMIAICTYSLSKCGASEVMDVVSNHQFALIKRGKKWDIIKNTERELIEEKIAELASFPELNPNPVIEADFAGAVHYLNQAAKALFPDLKTLGVQHPWLEDWDSVVTNFREKERASHVREIQIDDFWYEQAIYYVPEKKRIRIYGLDITERKRSEEALQESEAKYRSLFENMINGFAYHKVLFDDNGKPVDYVFLEVNDAFERLTGLRREDVIGKKVTEVIPGIKNDMANWIVTYGKVALTGEAAKFENYATALQKWYAVSACSPAKDYFAATFEDITERKQAEEALQKALDESKKHQIEISALLEGSRTVLESQDFYEAARSIFNSCKKLIGATAGYIALLSKDGTQNEVAFLDSGGLSCSVDPNLPMPIRGLRGIGYRTGEPVYNNDFSTSEFMKFMPKGHAILDNVLFAPLVVKKKVVGLIGLANKPGGFNEEDVRIASGFGELTAVALSYKRTEESLIRARDELELRIQERTAELEKTNEKLIEQSSILEGFFTATLTPLVFLDRDFNFVRVNEAYARACQRDISEFPRHNHFEFYPNEENEAIFRQVVETKTTYQAIAKPFVFPDHPEWGITYWDWTLTPLLDEAGEVEFLVFSLNDVTERKKAEEALQTASLYSRSLIEASMDPLVTISTEGKIMDVNKATELVTGVSRKRLIGSDFSEYFTEPDKAREGYQMVFTAGFVKDYPLAIRHTSGRITDVLYNATVYKNEAGEVQGVFAAARDVTKQKKTEEALRQAEEKYRSIYENIIEGIFQTTSDGRYISANPSLARMLGYKSYESLLAEVTDISRIYVDPDRRSDFILLMEAYDTVTGFESQVYRKDGSTIWISENARAVRDESGKLLHYEGTVEDITERKETEKRINANNTLLKLFAQTFLRSEYLDSVVELIQNWSGCRNVGIRVLDEEGNIPYESFTGFSKSFMESENLLSVKRDMCACIRVVTGRLEPQDVSVMTPGWSFYCNNTSKFLSSLSDEEKARFRGMCIKTGYASVAVVPIRYRDEILGAIHLADEREGKVPLKDIEFIESMSPLIGEAIYRFNIEKKLMMSKSSLAEAQRIAHLGNWEWDIQTNNLYWSDEIYRIFGLTPQQVSVTYDEFLNHIHPEDRELVNEAINEALYGKPYSIDHRIILSDGIVRIVHEQGEVAFGENGEPIRMLGTVQDITEKKEAEEALQEAKAKYAAIVEGFDGFIYICSENFDIEFMNERLIERTGYNAIQEKCYKALYGLEDVCSWCENDRVMEGEIVRQEINNPNDDRWYYVVNIPIQSQNGGISKIVMIQDITEEKENEMRLIMSERLSALGLMASGIAHEINNPLATIGGCAEGLLNRIKKGQFQHELFESYLKIIEEEVIRCKSITTNMLSFVKKRDYKKNYININEILDKTLELIDIQGRLKEVDVTRNYEGEMPLIRENEGELRQVFLAIIINALDSMEGKGTLTLETGIEDDTVFIKISDTGIGMSSELIDKIFNPFFTTKSDKGGAGLGLSIASKIVKDVHGRMDVTSEEGQGTTFKISLQK